MRRKLHRRRRARLWNRTPREVRRLMARQILRERVVRRCCATIRALETMGLGGPVAVFHRIVAIAPPF